MLEIQNITTAYGKKPILQGLTVEPIKPGFVVALLGPNGCGKSTLLKTLAGFNPVLSGRISLNETELNQSTLRERAKNIVYLPQSLPPSIHLQVFESILVSAHGTHHQTPIEIKDIQNLLEQIGIGHLAIQYLDQLSGGQKQLVGIAQALIRHPKLLLLDEPLSALDINYQFHVMELLRQETIRQNMITVVVLHDLNIALRHADYALILHKGHLYAYGKPSEIIQPKTLFDVYGIHARVEHCSQQIPYITIDGLNH